MKKINLLLMILIVSAVSVFAQDIVVSNDFEKGTEKWEARGPVSISSSKDQAASGTKSLRVSGRRAFWQGAQLNIIKLLSPGKSYKFTASVKLDKNNKADNVKMTIQRGSGGGESTYDGLAIANANADEWKTLSGTFKPAGSDGYILVYFEAEQPTTSFFIDDFKIEIAGDNIPAQSGEILKNDFEDMTAQEWNVRGDNVQMFSSNAGGSQNLKVSGRTQNWHGLQLDVSPLIFKGRTYDISVSVRLTKGQAKDNLKITMQETPLKGDVKYAEVSTFTSVTDAEWVTISGKYTGTTSDNNLVIYIEAANPSTAFHIDNFSIKVAGTTAAVDSVQPKMPVAVERDIPSLYKHLADYFPIGAAIWKGDLEGEHSVLVKKHFNAITSENDMKFEVIQPTEGNFDFSRADAQVAFAKANGMKIRGHTLVWHEQTPKWLFKDVQGNPMTPTTENKALLLKRLENHIRTVVKHFGDDIYAWDVVNEVIDPAESDGFRKSEWYKITGLDYIKTAFRVAREVNPKIKLFINDYATTDPKKRKFLYDLIANLQKEAVPIDGIGHQMHINIDYPSKDTIIETINLFNGLKIDNQITELDISIYKDYEAKTGFPDYESIDKTFIVKQGYKYQEVFDAFKSLKGKISSVTFWSHSDDHTWMTKPNKVDAPLLFDRSLKSKPAFWGVVDPAKLPPMVK